MEEPLLRIEHITKRYDEQIALEDVSLRVQRGEVVVIVGPSGCGKSTLLRCINGLEEVQEGAVWLGERRVDAKSNELTKLRQRIGLVFQNYELFPHLTVLNNIMLAPLKVQKRDKEEVRRDAQALLERVGLLEKQNSLPRQLSGGQKQRAAIVRALCMHPEILLFDEVTAALDPEMVREVLDVMMHLAAGGQTMMVVTHEMQFARAVADRIVFIDQGKIIEEAEPEVFFNNPASERVRQFLNLFQYQTERGKENETVSVNGAADGHDDFDLRL